MNLTFTEEEIKELLERAVTTAQDHAKHQRMNQAEILLKQSLRVDPTHLPTLRLLTEILMNQQKGTEAIKLYEKILELEPTDQVALNNIALCYGANKEGNKAIEKLQKCVELYPNEPSAHSNLALQYKNEGDDDNALASYLKGIDILPNNHDLRFNYGVFLAERFKFNEAIEQYEKAIEIKKDFYLAHFNLSLLHLLIGNYKKGWEEYEWRFGHEVFKKFKERFKGPEWEGEIGEGKTILVYNEQGAGDAIQFARYLPELKKRGFKVVLEVIYDLVDLLAQCDGVDIVIPQRSKNTPAYDCHVSIGSLPLKLGIYEPFFNGPYIQPTGSVNEKTFSDYKEFTKIGICWAGNPVHKHDSERSCSLKNFKPVNDLCGVKLFSLQKDIRPRFWANQGVVDLTDGCDNMGIINMSDLLVNFNYTAAIMKCMKCIVTVDTAVAHLAGAMGIPCYVLLPRLPDWRWGLNSNNTKWYDSIKLMRKEENYENNFSQIAYEIKHM